MLEIRYKIIRNTIIVSNTIAIKSRNYNFIIKDLYYLNSFLFSKA